MTCRDDCLCYDACMAYNGGMARTMCMENKAENRCGCFKNKAGFVGAEKYNELRENFIGFACSGVNNVAPYCKNRCAECVDARGWCRYGEGCRGFNPDGEGRDT